MPANICVPLFKGGEKDVTVRTTTAVVGKTFGKINANIQSGPEITTATLPATYDGGNLQATTCGAGQKADGVFAYDRAINEVVPLIRSGAIAPVTASAAVTAGQQVMSDAAGKAVPFVPGTYDPTLTTVQTLPEYPVPVGKAVTDAALNADCYVELY